MTYLINLLNEYYNLNTLSYNDNIKLIFKKYELIDLIFLDKNNKTKELNKIILKIFNSITDIDLLLWIEYKINKTFNKLNYFDLAMWLLWNNIDFLICENLIKNEYDYISLLYYKNLNPTIKLCMEIIKN